MEDRNEMELPDQLRDWIASHELINVHQLEKKANVPVGSIQLALKSGRRIPLKHVRTIAAVLKEYGCEIG